MALICRKHVISSSKRQHLHPVNAVEWTTVTNEWIVGKRSTLLLSQKGDWIADSITFLPREKDSKWGTHLRFFSPGHWRYSSCWAYKCVVAWRSIKLKLELWQFLLLQFCMLPMSSYIMLMAEMLMYLTIPDDVFLAKRSSSPMQCFSQKSCKTLSFIVRTMEAMYSMRQKRQQPIKQHGVSIGHYS